MGCGNTGLKRDSLDALISDLIRESFDWKCARCSKEFPDRKARDCHCSHFYSRQFNSTRWHPNNLTCICATCHDYLGKHPDEHTDFIRALLGPGAYEMLRDRNRQVYRYREADKKAMKKHYRAELERIHALRTEGVTGYISVVSYD